MSLLGQPVPRLDHRPHAFGAPPGVGTDFEAFRADDGRAWWETRPKIVPRVGIVHTNAARNTPGGASLQSQVNFANGGMTRTHPHYCLNEGSLTGSSTQGPTKFVPTDRRSIANSSPAWFEQQTGEVDPSFWTISIETADHGSDNVPNSPADMGPFLHDHAELVARIVAYESIVWGIPISVPDVWNGRGWVTHTDPFPFPHYTSFRGKTCPGVTKKDRFLRGDILPRAREIEQVWREQLSSGQQPQQKDEHMRFIEDQASGRVLDTRQGPHPAKLAARVPLEVPRHPQVPANATGVHVTITATQTEGAGFVHAGPVAPAGTPSTSMLQTSGDRATSTTGPVAVNAAGEFVLWSTTRTHLIVDVIGYYL